MNAGDIVAHLKARANEFRAGMNEARGDLDSFKRRAQAVSRTLNDVGKKMTKYLTLPIVGIAGAAVKTAAGFEQSMQKVSALSGATGESLGKLRDLAMQMGRETRYSAVESADALSFLAMAGFDVEQSLAALPSVLELAAAGNLDLATTADYASNILTGFGLEAEEMARVSDVLAATFTASNTNLSQLAEGMKYVAPIAAGMKIPIEEVSAAMGLLGDAGMQGSMAGTTLRTVIQRLISPTGEAADIIERLGLEVNDAEGEFVGFVDIVRQLEEAGASTQDMMEMFGARGAGMIALVQRGSADFADFVEELENAEGTGERIAETMLEGLAGSMTILRGSIETLLIVIGERFLPILTEWVDKAVEIVNQISEWDDEQWKLVGTIAAVLAIGGPFLIFLSKMINIVTALKLKMFILKGGLTAMSGGMVTAGGATAAFGAKLAAFGAKLAALAAAGGPILLVVAAIGLVGYAIYTMVKEGEEDIVRLKDTVAAEMGLLVDDVAARQADLLIAQQDRHVAELEAEIEHREGLVEQQRLRNIELEILEEELAQAKAGKQGERHQAEIEAEIAHLQELIAQGEAKIGELVALEKQLEAEKLAAQRLRHAQEIIAEQAFIDALAKVEEDKGEAVIKAFDQFKENYASARDAAMEEEIKALIAEYGRREEMTEEAFNVRLQHIKDKYAEEEMWFRTEHVPEFLRLHQDKLTQAGLVYDAGINDLVEITEREAAGLAVVSGKAGDEMIEALLQAVEDGEIPVAAAVDALALLIDGGMAQIREIGEDHGYHSVASLIEGLYKGEQDAIDAAYAIGEAISEGYGDGIDSRESFLIESGEDMVYTVWGAANRAAERYSPSRLFMRLGEGISEGVEVGILNGAERLVAAAVETVERAINGVKRFLGIRSASRVGIDIGMGIVNGIREGVLRRARELAEAAVQAARDAINAVKRFLRMSSPSLLTMQIGMGLIDGIREGVMRRAAELARAAVQAARNAIDAVKRLLRMQSPSGVGIDIGVNFVGSIGEGIESMSDRVKEAMADVFDFPEFAAPGVGAVRLPEVDQAREAVMNAGEAAQERQRNMMQERIEQVMGSMNEGQTVLMLLDKQALKKLSRELREANLSERWRGVR